VLLVLMILYGYWPPVSAVVTVLLLSLLATAATLGFSLWISALNTRYRDVRYLVPYALQVLLFASPIVYSSVNIPEPLRSLYGLNPMATVIEGMRAVLLGTPDMSVSAYLLSTLVTLIFLLTGIWFFRRAEGSFADVM
jgi:lipopolysaccharide transport system permease protein